MHDLRNGHALYDKTRPDLGHIPLANKFGTISRIETRKYGSWYEEKYWIQLDDFGIDCVFGTDTFMVLNDHAERELAENYSID